MHETIKLMQTYKQHAKRSLQTKSIRYRRMYKYNHSPNECNTPTMHDHARIYTQATPPRERATQAIFAILCTTTPTKKNNTIKRHFLPL